ncbi:protoporphyrinogen oxidase [Grosmannia clavigera kw1407]|uniref:Protoporphyrinogen oxidase n=1 Tax=Grosmannia clavigera (strain kw1407 / UAMH 11150) TaxID=655863 RepID=F0XRK0_GROCL|nr:protoporphyrinogen oxidase [Grosmannia clavigera kw1407]EFW99918.1 protoporphyrinogen oxidase [Grosmannia clavigera kw1407]
MAAASHGAADLRSVLARGSLGMIRRRRQPAQVSIGWHHVFGGKVVGRVGSRRWYSELGSGLETGPAASKRSVQPPQDVAILGGGLTGLVTAHYLAELLPATARITLYEGSDRLGGWIDSEAWEGETGSGSGSVILEAGARMVAPQRNSARYDDLLFLDLVDRLDLAGALRVCDERPAQYIYYPDHLVNVSMGGGSSEGDTLGGRLWRMAALGYRALTEPVFSGLLSAMLGYVVPSPSRAAEVRRRTAAAYGAPSGLPPDDSVGGFALRQLGGGAGGRALVDNLLGAVMHGIYGGDVWRLSAASSPLRGSWIREGVAPLLAAYVRRVAGQSSSPAMSATQVEHLATIASGKYALAQDRDMEMLVDLLGGGDSSAAGTSPRLLRLAAASTRWSAMGFAGGFGALTDALARRLVERPNVTLRLGSAVERVQLQGPKVAVTTSASAGSHDKVISTLVSSTLYRITDQKLPALAHEHAVTIMVVNLHYAQTGLNGANRGFGYLIPATVPLAENPEGALGVIFDTDRELVQRRLTEDEGGLEDGSKREGEVGQPNPDESGTTFTVMLGGHYWDDYGPEDYPSEAQAVAMAEAVVQRHLRLSLADETGASSLSDVAPSPIATRAKLCRGCIPQHYVGHADRMAAADGELAAAFGRRLAVAGGSFTATGPGVLPSIRSARDVALRTAGRGYRLRRARNGRNETEMAHVGDTGLGRFGEPASDEVSPVPLRRLPLRFGNGVGGRKKVE